MTLFNMDDLSDQVSQLNYKIIDDPYDPDQERSGQKATPVFKPYDAFYNNETETDSAAHNHAFAEENDDAVADSSLEDDYIVTEYSGNEKRLQVPQRNRRGSHSVDLRIDEPFISSSVKHETSYRPTVEDFEPLMVLGKGSYGKVLLVRQLSTGKLFAQKQLKKVSLLMNNEINLTRTLNEKRILEQVNHPNIVKLYYAFQDSNKVYLILEYLDGGELFYHLRQESFLPEPKAAYYIAQLILALRYLHLHLNVIYRDLKPENCMLDSNGSLVLTDFGLSKVSDNEKSNSLIGTVQYMAPEILRNESHSFEVDWWSLGCISFDLLTGNPPFTGNNNKKISEKILASKKNLKFPFYLSLDAKDFLRKLLVPNVEKRLNLDNDDDFEKIKKHRFFRTVNWQVLSNPNDDPDFLPPILPVITNPILAENFDKEFKEMSFTPPLNRPKDDILFVKDFTFTNDKFLNNYPNFKANHINS